MPSTSSFFDDQTQTGSQIAWINLANVEVSDEISAETGPITVDERSNILHVSNFFTFDVPNSYRLLGIEINVEWQVIGGGSYNATILRLEQNQAAIAGADNKGPSSIPTVETVDTFGSSTDLWGTGFTHINDLVPSGGTISDFGFALEVTFVSGGTHIIIDSIECVIHFQPTKSGAKLIRSYYRSPSKRHSGAHPAGF